MICRSGKWSIRKRVAQDFYKDVSLARLTLLSLPVGLCSLEAGWVVCPESQIDWSWCTTRFKSANKRGCDWCTHSRVQNPNHAVDDEIPIDPLRHSVSYSPAPTTGTTLCHRSAAFHDWLLHPGRAYRNLSQMKRSQNSNSFFVFFLCVCRTVSFLQSRLTGNYTVINMVANMVSTVKQGNRQPKHFGLQGRWVDCIFKTWCLHYPWCNLATEWHHWRHFFQITWGNKRLILHFLEYVVLLPKTCKPTLMCKGRLWLRGLNQHLVARSVALVCMLKCTWATYWTPNSSLQWQPLPSVYEGITVSRFGQRHLPNALNVCM